MSTDVTPAPTHEGSAPVLSIADLNISFSTEDGVVDAVKGVGFDVAPGEIVAIVGESGSGKSVTSMSVLGLLPKTSTIDGARQLADVELGGMPDKELRKIRGNDVAMIFQEPMTALNPVFTVGWQIRESLRAHRELSKADADTRAIELLELVGIPDPSERFKQYPHQLSGGLRQRVVIAMAISCDPKVIIADEPTTALDVTVQAEILGLLRTLRDTLDTAIVLITHDMGVVADLADRVVVMYDGEIVEQASATQLFESPQQEYTRKLLAAVPVLGHRPANRRLAEEDTGDSTASTTEHSTTTESIQLDDAELNAQLDISAPALAIENLVLEFPGKRRQAKNRAVDDVSLHIDAGEIVGLVGESGSGKSTVGRCATRLLKPTAGSVSIAGKDITHLAAKDLRPLRRYFSIVFQDPASTLDPKMTIGDSVAEPLVLHKVVVGADLESRVKALLERVELSGHYRNRYPHELSGGQRQRVAIARALALSPQLLIADEPTSALDVSVQARVLDLFLELQQTLRFACLFISHDLAVVDLLADRVAVMQHGKLVEVGARDQVLHAPQENYTKRLLSAAPVADPTLQAQRRQAWEAGKLAPVAD